MENGIDFVMPWVDGNDPEWQKERAKYSPSGQVDDRPERYRDWETLKYWFRGVEKYAPWVRQIHFLTWGHLPSWMNVNNPKLHIVKHEDFIPQEFLPVFSSNPIEMHLHRIPNLTERFVYFNDDMLILNNVKEEDFFVGNMPRDMLALQPVIANPQNETMSRILLNESIVISKYFDKRTTMKKNPGGYFHIGYPLMYFVYNVLELAFPQYTGFYSVHGPSPLLKSSVEEVWEKEADYLNQVSTNRFRSGDDVCQYLFREWNKQKGDFVPANILKDFQYIHVDRLPDKELNILRKHKCKLACANDTDTPIDFEEAKRKLLDALEDALPEKSSFEV